MYASPCFSNFPVTMATNMVPGGHTFLGKNGHGNVFKDSSSERREDDTTLVEMAGPNRMQESSSTGKKECSSGKANIWLLF